MSHDPTRRDDRTHNGPGGTPENAPARSERTLDLLCESSLWGLDEPERAELQTLSAASDARPDTAQFDAAVASLDTLFHGHGGEALPDALRSACLAAGRSALHRSDRAATLPMTNAVASRTGSRAATAVGGQRFLGALGWFAAAAALVFAAVVFSQRGATAEPDYRAMMAAALERSDVVRTAWAAIDAAKLADAPHRFDRNAAGRLVWDERGQQGWMTFTGLAKNNPKEYQYQLWIFDAKRGGLEQHPVDGGVFDVTADGEVILPIDAKLPVDEPFLFAITVEPPGGSVVSERDIVLVAPVQG